MIKTYTIKKDQQKQIVINKSGSYTVKLTGDRARVDIRGAFYLTGKNTLNINITVIHSSPHTNANTNLRAVVDDHAKAEINGTIIVEKRAQQTNSFLSEKVLLLSKTAQAHVVPNLEIEADDVKCSHAATVGAIDKNQLFYLQSRGISQKKAKSMIAKGFLQDIKDRISPQEK